jgi:hypothetical protein
MFARFRVPLMVAVNKIGWANVIDASLIEEACSKCALWVGVSPPDTSTVEVDLAQCTVSGWKLHCRINPIAMRIAA